MGQARNSGAQRRDTVLVVAITLIALLAAAAPRALSQSGGGSVTNNLPVVEADGSYTECGALAFGNQDGSIGPTITTNDGTAGRTYNRTGTANDTLKWGEWAALPGAVNVSSGSGAEELGRYIKAVSSASTATPENFTFEVRDDNGEQDIAFVRVSSTDSTLNETGNGTGGSGYAPTAADRANTSLPTSGPGVDANGFAVWNPTPDNGRLCVRFRYTWPAGQATGTYTQRAFAKDEGAEQGAPTPADDDTTTFATTASVSLSFSANRFVGQTNATYNVSINSNIDFNWTVVASPAADPSALTFANQSLDDADGALAVTLSSDQTMWLWYKVDIKSTTNATIIMDQTYATSFTWA